MRERPKSKQGSGNGGNRTQSSSAAPTDRVALKGTTFGASGGTSVMYALNNRQEQENSPDIVTGMIRVFDFTIYTLLDPGESLSFVTPYVSMNFDIIHKKTSELLSFSTLVGDPFYHRE